MRQRTLVALGAGLAALAAVGCGIGYAARARAKI